MSIPIIFSLLFSRVLLFLLSCFERKKVVEFGQSCVWSNHYKVSIYLYEVPKNLNNVDKNAYISSYIHDVCNSVNYVYTNKWKPNSNWIWILKG